MAAINISYKETTAKRVTTISLLSLKLDSHLQKNLCCLLDQKSFKNNGKCFLFQLKSSFS